MKKIKVMMVLLVIFLGICGWTVMSIDVGPTKESAANNLAVKDADQAAEILGRFINANQVDSHGMFYDMLRVTKKDNLQPFKIAMKKYGTAELLINFGPYLKKLLAPITEEFKKNPNMDSAAQLSLQKRGNALTGPLTENLNELLDEIAFVAKKNPQPLVLAIKKAVMDEKAVQADFSGPLIGLYSMEEEGAAILLKYADGDGENKGMLAVMAMTFGPLAVIPTFKQYENPASTAKEKNAAGMAIYLFPDTEQVFDKVIEAYKHGRYFEPTGNKKDADGKTVYSVAGVFSEIDSWWGNVLKSRYKDNEVFATYVAKKYLNDPEGQSKIIEFLSKVDFGAAAPYFMALDIDKISKESLDSLIHSTYTFSSSFQSAYLEKGEKEYRAEKFKLFSQIFRRLSAEERSKRKIIYNLSGFSPEYRSIFKKENAGIFTDEEKKTIAALY